MLSPSKFQRLEEPNCVCELNMSISYERDTADGYNRATLSRDISPINYFLATDTEISQDS